MISPVVKLTIPDYVLVLCSHSKAEAQHLKQAIAMWLQEHLGLTQHPEKTCITHWDKPIRFLGYDARGQRNLNGTRWLRLTIPPEAERKLKGRVKRLCGYTQVPALDLFMSVNAQMRGWANYYCYASNAGKRFRYLTGMVFWLTAHYLGRKYRVSIKKLMRTHYGKDQKTGKRCLYIIRPNGKRLSIWHDPPKWRSVLTGQPYAQDIQAIVMTSWAGGHSYEQRQQLHASFDNRCQNCGKESERLIPLTVHHTNRLGRIRKRKLGPANIIQSAEAQEVKLLCSECHKQHHPNGGWNDGKP